MIKITSPVPRCGSPCGWGAAIEPNGEGPTTRRLDLGTTEDRSRRSCPMGLACLLAVAARRTRPVRRFFNYCLSPPRLASCPDRDRRCTRQGTVIHRELDRGLPGDRHVTDHTSAVPRRIDDRDGGRRRREFERAAGREAQEPKRASANDTIRHAVIGCRIRGRVHAAEFGRQAGVEVAYVCDPDRELAEELAASVEKRKDAGPRPSRTCARSSTTSRWTPSPSRRRTTGTRWRRSGPCRPARTCTSRSRSATTSAKAGASCRWRRRPAASARRGRRTAPTAPWPRPSSTSAPGSSAT